MEKKTLVRAAADERLQAIEGNDGAATARLCGRAIVRARASATFA
jgi:hypothetical protein